MKTFPDIDRLKATLDQHRPLDSPKKKASPRYAVTSHKPSSPPNLWFATQSF